MEVLIKIFCIICAVSIIAANDVDKSESSHNSTQRNLNLCVLPAYPENGRYYSYPSGLPGSIVETFQLNVTCKHRYKLVGGENVRCIDGVMTPEMPVCLPFCKIEQQSTVTCEPNIPRCVLTSADEILTRSNVGSADADCGTLHFVRRRRLPVSGGYRPNLDEFPWHTGIYRKVPAPIQQICGGALVSKRVVLSAAHCFSAGGEPPVASNYAMAAGKIFRSWNNMADSSAQRKFVKEIKIPPRYQGALTNYQEDIAVLISDDEFSFEEFVKPVCLNFDPKFDEEQLSDRNLGKIAGWGLTNEESLPSMKLRAAFLPYRDISKCIEESPASFKSSITGDKFCAGYVNGTSACRGDSGGGFVMATEEDAGERYYLRGIISTSPVNGKDCNIYTWVTFTHVLRHANFIKSVARGLL